MARRMNGACHGSIEQVAQSAPPAQRASRVAPSTSSADEP